MPSSSISLGQGLGSGVHSPSLRICDVLVSPAPCSGLPVGVTAILYWAIRRYGVLLHVLSIGCTHNWHRRHVGPFFAQPALLCRAVSRRRSSDHASTLGIVRNACKCFWHARAAHAYDTHAKRALVCRSWNVSYQRTCIPSVDFFLSSPSGAFFSFLSPLTPLPAPLWRCGTRTIIRISPGPYRVRCRELPTVSRVAEYWRGIATSKKQFQLQNNTALL